MHFLLSRALGNIQIAHHLYWYGLNFLKYFISVPIICTNDTQSLNSMLRLFAVDTRCFIEVTIVKKLSFISLEIKPEVTYPSIAELLGMLELSNIERVFLACIA